MSSSTASSRQRRQRQVQAAPPRPSNRAIRAAAQRESTAHALETPPSFFERLSGPVVWEPPVWRGLAALVISLLGLGVSIYLTIDHFAKIPLACSDTGVINCQKVTTSAQSYFLHIPVAVLGLAFFVGMTALNLPVAWRARDRRIHLLRLVGTVVGMGFALYLISAEVLIIKNICLWCTSVHFLTFLLFLLMLATVPPMMGWTGVRAGTWATTATPTTDAPDATGVGAATD